MNVCDRCGRREATHKLIVEGKKRRQCGHCADVGRKLAQTYGLACSVVPLVDSKPIPYDPES